MKNNIWIIIISVILAIELLIKGILHQGYDSIFTPLNLLLLLFGVLFLISSILIFLNKKWIKIPLIIIVIGFIIWVLKFFWEYIIKIFGSSFMLNNAVMSKYYFNAVIVDLLFNIEYLIFSIIILILVLKMKK